MTLLDIIDKAYRMDSYLYVTVCNLQKSNTKQLYVDDYDVVGNNILFRNIKISEGANTSNHTIYRQFHYNDIIGYKEDDKGKYELIMKGGVLPFNRWGKGS